MSTALRQRTHRKRLGGGGGAGWAVGMGGPFPCVSRCSGQPRPLREILTAATAPSKAVGLGARRWVARKVTATVAPASWHRYPICTARRQRCARPLRRCTPPPSLCQRGHAQGTAVPYAAGTPIRFAESSQQSAGTDSQCARLLADTRFTRKSTAVHRADKDVGRGSQRSSALIDPQMLR
jgi:hypothetical protein